MCVYLYVCVLVCVYLCVCSHVPMYIKDRECFLGPDNMVLDLIQGSHVDYFESDRMLVPPFTIMLTYFLGTGPQVSPTWIEPHTYPSQITHKSSITLTWVLFDLSSASLPLIGFRLTLYSWV